MLATAGAVTSYRLAKRRVAGYSMQAMRNKHIAYRTTSTTEVVVYMWRHNNRSTHRARMARMATFEWLLRTLYILTCHLSNTTHKLRVLSNPNSKRPTLQPEVATLFNYPTWNSTPNYSNHLSIRTNNKNNTIITFTFPHNNSTSRDTSSSCRSRSNTTTNSLNASSSHRHHTATATSNKCQSNSWVKLTAGTRLQSRFATHLP